MHERRRPSLAQFAPQTVLDAQQCAEWLGCSVDTLEAADVPCAFLTARVRLYVVGEVLDFLNKKMRRAS